MPNRHLDNIPEGEASKYYSLPRLKRKETWRKKGVSCIVRFELPSCSTLVDASEPIAGGKYA